MALAISDMGLVGVPAEKEATRTSHTLVKHKYSQDSQTSR